MRTLLKSLIEHERISTTEAKARELRPMIEKLVTQARKDTVASRRLVASRLGGESATIVKKLFATIAPRYKERAGGYVRIVKRAPRADGRRTAYIAFVD